MNSSHTPPNTSALFDYMLRDSYSNLCALIGRGHATYNAAKPFLGMTRKGLYELVVKHAMSDGRPGTWPLWMCFPHRRLVACSLAGESHEDTAADRFLVDGVIAAVAEVLSDPLKFIESVPSDAFLVSLEEGIPLSLSHARIFCLSVLRLDASDRVTALSALIDALHSGVTSLDTAGSGALWESEAFARFLGRAVATCTSLAVCVTSNISLLGPLRTIVGSESTIYVEKATWKMAELSFCSIFDDSTYSELEGPDVRESTLAKEKAEALQALLHRSFKLGFKFAPSDNSYLLFASWAATGKSDLWRPDVATSIPSYAGLPEELAMLVLELRNDVCYVSRLHHLYSRGAYDSSFLRAIDRKLLGHGMMAKKTLSEKISQALKLMVAKAESLSTDLCERYGDVEIIPSEVCCLLECIPAYVSYAISCHTTTDQDFFRYLQTTMKENRRRKRSQSYSSDSDNCSDDDSVDSQDLLIDAADRLQDVCSSFGAVPAHPDWLDIDCELSDCVKPAEAVSSPLRCVELLGKVASIGLEKLSLHQLGDAPPRDARLASGLLRMRLLGNSIDKTTSVVSTTPHLSALTGIDDSLLDGSVKASDVDRRSQIRRRWIAESSQRCPGSLQEPMRRDYINNFDYSILRAGHEWEVLLSGPLSTCALHAASNKAEINSTRWAFVADSAINALIPSSSLLYFLSSNAKRKRHPLKLVDSCVDANDCSNISAFYHPVVTNAKLLPASSTQVVSRTLGIISQSFDLVADRVSEAIAANLAVQREDFQLLRAVATVRFAFAALRDLVACSTGSCKAVDSFLPLFNLISSAIECGATSSHSSDRHMKIAIGIEDLAIRSIAPAEIGVREALASWFPTGFIAASLGSCVQAIVACIWPDSRIVDAESRLRFLQALVSLTSCDDVLSHLACELGRTSDSRLRSLIEHDICGIHGARSVEIACPTGPVAALLASTLTSMGPESASRAEFVYGIMEQYYGTWMHQGESQDVVLNLFLLLATRCRQLHIVGRKLVEDLAAGSSTHGVAALAAFLRGLRRRRQGDAESHHGDDALQPQQPQSRRCSHARHLGFVNQHWYHCVTCNLTGDKGCCTVCAVICHAGHEVSYSRFSAFFCDCGAESGMQGRCFECKCLTEVSQDVFERSMASGLRTTNANVRDGRRWVSSSSSLSSAESCTSIAMARFPDTVDESLRLFIDLGRREDWFTRVLSSAYIDIPELRHSSVGATTYESTRSLLRDRASSVSFLPATEMGSLSCTGAFRSGAFKVRMSEENSVESLKRALLSTGGTFRKAMTSTSRGLVLVAETNSVLLCTLLPAICAPDSDSRLQLPRSSACIVGAKPIGFNIVGLRLCDSMEDRLVVWGTHEASVAILNESRTSVDRILAIDVGLGTIESSLGVVLDCGWLPSSSSFLFVCSTRSLVLYEVKGASSVARVSTLIDGAESAIRGFVVSELKSRSRARWKCHVLTDDGHLHAIELRCHAGSLYASNLNIDPRNSIKIPVNSSKDSSPAFSLTLGEGIDLTFLQQSRLLLYQAVGESVLALPLDEACSISSSFILLPKCPLPGISGPFRHFTELGLVVIDSVAHFRVFCVGRRDSNEAALLLIDFSHSNTRIKELQMGNSSFGSGSTPVVEGVAAFSSPFATKGVANLEERCLLAVLLSNGSLLVFGEECGTPTISLNTCISSTRIAPVVNAYVPPASSDVPLLAFEELENVMETDDVVIESADLGRYVVGGATPHFVVYTNSSPPLTLIRSPPDLRKKLLRDNGEYLAATGFDGCSLTIRLKPGFSLLASRALIAFRFLVGLSAASSIPRKITVQGRDLRLQPDLQQWYTVFLTQQEATQAFRIGFVTIRLSDTFDSCTNSVVDAIECYACKLTMISCWIPGAVQSVASRPAKDEQGKAGSSTQPLTPSLSFCLEVLAELASILRPLKPLDESQIGLLRRLLSDTVVVYNAAMSDSIDAILSALHWDEDAQDEFRDAAVLDGCNRVLDRCREMLKPTVVHSNWHRVSSPLRCCLKAASKVVAMRPLEYRAFFGNRSTLGDVSSGALVECFKSSDASLAMLPDLVDLCRTSHSARMCRCGMPNFYDC